MRIRQVALVAKDRDRVVDELCSVLGVEVAFEDPGIDVFGLHNAVMPVGRSFLEVVSPIRGGTTAGRHLERHGGDTGYMVIVQTSSLDRDRVRMSELGVRIVWEHAEQHTSTIHLHPRDVGGAILSLDQSVPWNSWDWAGPDWEAAVRTDSVTGIVGASLRARDPAAMATRWGAVLEAEAIECGDQRLALSLGEGDTGVRFEPLEGGDAEHAGKEGVCGIEVVAVEPAAIRERARSRGLAVHPSGEVEIGGTRIRLVDAWASGAA